MPRARIMLLTLAGVVIAAGVSLVVVGLRSDGSAPILQIGAAAGAGAVAPVSTGPGPAELARQERRRRASALDAALTSYAASVPEYSLAVLDRATGQSYAYRGNERYDTASVVKVEVLACLLLKAQDADRDLTSGELALAKSMIRRSDNAATTTLFNRLGRVDAITRSNKRLGLTNTVVKSSWGLTRTTVNDQVKLLAAMADPAGPLDADSRKLASGLMTTVVREQRWGVSAAAHDGETTALKNGWDTRTADNGRWAVNSVGLITGDGVDVAIAVLSHGHRSQTAGIKVVEKVAQLSRKHLKW